MGFVCNKVIHNCVLFFMKLHFFLMQLFNRHPKNLLCSISCHRLPVHHLVQYQVPPQIQFPSRQLEVRLTQRLSLTAGKVSFEKGCITFLPSTKTKTNDDFHFNLNLYMLFRSCYALHGMKTSGKLIKLVLSSPSFILANPGSTYDLSRNTGLVYKQGFKKTELLYPLE